MARVKATPKRKPAPKRKPKAQKQPTTKAKLKPKQSTSDVSVQPYIATALEKKYRSGTRNNVYTLSENKITPNKKMKKETKPARYGAMYGTKGPNADFAGPIVRKFPRGISDIRQLMINAPNNEVPDEFGITNKNRMPMQNITPTRGGKYSGRTGPIR